jgi:hypothetical protein
MNVGTGALVVLLRDAFACSGSRSGNREAGGVTDGVNTL